MTIQTIIDDLRAINTEDIVRAVATEHKTNQQLVAKNIFAILKHWSDAYEADNYDLRNEATVKLAHKMVSGSEELSKGDLYLPYI
jgi:hypothetical protein